jgi:two-component system nitrogen regulation response regulator NtrX
MPPLSRESHAAAPAGDGDYLRGEKEEFEKDYIAQKLAENKWNIKKTAKAIGLERSNLHKKIKAYGLDEGKQKGR